jgi:prepilin-type N-terminal cleavage/methylation domain-containing protein
MVVPGAVVKQGGFTLVEVLITSLIMGVIFGGMVSMLMMYTRELREGVAMSRLQMQYENIALQMADKARSADAVVKTTDAWPVATTFTADSADGVYMKDASGTILAGYQVTNGVFQEYVGGNWINYKSGSYSTSAAGGLDSVTAGKPFFLSATRKNVTLTFNLKTTVASTTDTLKSRGDMFLCRN